MGRGRVKVATLRHANEKSRVPKSDAIKDDLARSGLTVADAERSGMFYTPNARTIYRDFKARPAIVIPYHDHNGELVTFERDGEQLPFCRVRYLGDLSEPISFTRKKPQRYGQPKNSGVRAYFPLTDDFDWAAVAADVSVPIVITEGEKKALAATLAGFPTIGLGGVYNFLHNGKLIPELEAIALREREVFVCYDSDAASNPMVQMAQARLVEELTKRGAKVILVALQPDNDNNTVSIDDFLVANGPSGLTELFNNTPALGRLDAAVVALNSHVAWIASDGGVYDLHTRKFIRKDDFVTGSSYSTQTVDVIVTTGTKPTVKKTKVASTWLHHTLARRYADMLFQPGNGPTIETPHGEALNIWNGWEAERGNIQPFLDLTEFIFSELPKEHRDLALKLVIYKAQNPMTKTPIATVLIGDQGSGKTLWADCVREAFGIYGITVSSTAINSDFQGWMEKSVMAVVQEAVPEDLIRASAKLKTLISDKQQFMNEKYRVARLVDSHTQYILTSNSRRTGAFAADDRRMFVVGCPQPRDFYFYAPFWDWRDAGGPKALMHWFLTYDLKGWKPPQKPPLTAEKFMAYIESLTPIQKLAEDMKTAKQHVIAHYIDQAVAWANENINSPNVTLARQASETVRILPELQLRPWYTPDELAGIFPDIAAQLYSNRKLTRTSAGAMSSELRDNGIPYLECYENPKGFRHNGMIKQYLIVADQDEWKGKRVTQAEFDRLMQGYPRYKQVRTKKLKAQGDG